MPLAVASEYIVFPVSVTLSPSISKIAWPTVFPSKMQVEVAEEEMAQEVFGMVEVGSLVVVSLMVDRG